MKAKRLVLSGLWFLTTAIYAAQHIPTARGNAGLAPFTVAVRNIGEGTLDCQVTTAHWYSVALGAVAPGAGLSTVLWKDIASGEILMLNSQQDRMPVQRFWCGEAGKSWQTRSDIVMPNRRNVQPPSLALVCTSSGERVQCRSAPVPGR